MKSNADEAIQKVITVGAVLSKKLARFESH